MGTKALVTRRIGSVAVIAVAYVVLSASLALAGSAREYGAMVDYQLVFPVGGPVSLSDTFYAARSNGDHHAQDLMAPKMTPVLAAASGTVHYVNWSRNPDELNAHRCCTITIRHDDGWESWYIHLNNDTPGTDDGQAWGIVEGIVPGTRVEAGQQIGWVGDSGNAENTSPHLHFELFDAGGVIVNPYNSLLNACGSSCTSTSRASQTPTTTAAGPNDTLILGSRGDVVADLQSTLRTLGFDPGPADGIFGRMTLTAVVAFQSAKGLTVDGKVGPATKSALGSSPTASAPVTSGPAAVVAYGIFDSSVVELQGMLAKLGHAPGPVDGAFGPLTLVAVTRFQTAAGLPGTGTVDQATWDALVVAAGGSTGGTTTIVVGYATRGAKVLELQQMLAALGHAPGPVDGIFGPMTRSAVAAFQSSSGLDPDGIVGQATWDGLATAQTG